MCTPNGPRDSEFRRLVECTFAVLDLTSERPSRHLRTFFKDGSRSDDFGCSAVDHATVVFAIKTPFDDDACSGPNALFASLTADRPKAMDAALGLR